MSEHYPEAELWDLSIQYLLASDPVIWWKWAEIERRVETDR